MSFMKLMAEVGLNIGPFQTGLNKLESAASKSASSIGNSIKGAFGAYFGYQAFQKVIGDTWRNMAKIKDLSDQFSTTTDEVQRLQAAAGNVGMEFEDLGGALIRMTNARADAQKGNEDAIESFRLLGISVDELNDPAKENVDIMRRMSVVLKDVNMTTQQMAAMKDVFGKSGGRMLAAIREIENVNEPFIKQEDIDKVDAMEESVKKLGRTIGVALAPAVADVSDGITAAIQDKKSFLKDYLKSFADPFGIFSRPDTSTKGLDSSPLPMREKVDIKPSEKKKTKQELADEKLTSQAESAEAKGRYEIEKKLFEIALKNASQTDKIKMLKERSTKYSREMEELEEARAIGLVDELEYQKLIAEYKEKQLGLVMDLNDAENNKKNPSLNFSGLSDRFGPDVQAAAVRAMATTPAGRTEINGMPVKLSKEANELLRVISSKLDGKIKFSN